MFDFHILKNTIRQSFCVMAVCGLLVSCVSVEKASDAKYPPNDPQSVEFLNVTPYKPYSKIGTVDAHGFSDDALNDMQQTVREKAAEEGADAIIISGEGYKETSWGDGDLWEQGDMIRYNSSAPAIVE